MKAQAKKKQTRADVAPQRSFRDQGVAARVHSANAEIQSQRFMADFRRVVVFMKYREDDTDAIERHAAQMLKGRGQDMQGVTILATCETSLSLVAIAGDEKDSE